jgi:predicted DNA binding CopG/RHH family protein
MAVEEERKVSFRISAEEDEIIKAAAREQGISVSEYVRARVLSDGVTSDKGAAETQVSHIERLLRHLVYITSRTHVAVYSIAQTAGTISTEQLREIYDGARAEGLDYMANLAERMAKAEARIASQSRTNKPPEAA